MHNFSFKHILLQATEKFPDLFRYTISFEMIEGAFENNTQMGIGIYQTKRNAEALSGIVFKNYFELLN